MFDFWESISKLPEGPLIIILEKLADSYAVHLDNLTLHVDYIAHCHAGGPGDLLYIMLAYRWGLVTSVKLCTYQLWQATLAPRLRIRGVRFVGKERFSQYMELVNNRVKISFEDRERPILEAWKNGKEFEEAWKSFYKKQQP